MSSAIDKVLICISLVAALPLGLTLSSSDCSASVTRSATTVEYGRAWNKSSLQINEIPIIIVQDESSHAFDFGLRIGTGYFSDPDKLDGLAHIAEHMIAHGKLPTFSEALSDWKLQDQQRSLWFHTDGEYTDFYLACDVGDESGMLRRLNEALTRFQYTDEDVAAQLNAIENDRRSYEKSISGLIDRNLGNLATPAHPASRVFSSGDEKALKELPLSELTKQVNNFLSAHYPGNISAITVISPYPASKADALLRDALGGVLNAPHPEKTTAAYEPLEVFAGTGSTPQLIPFGGQSDVVVLQYAVRDHARSFGSHALELAEMALSNGSGQSLTAIGRAAGYAQKISVTTSAGEFGNEDSLRVTATLAHGHDTNIERLVGAIRQSMVLLLQAPDQDGYASLERRLEQKKLLGPQVPRPNMIFGILDKIASGETASVLSYLDGSARRGQSQFIALEEAIQKASPVILFLKNPDEASNNHQPFDPKVIETSSEMTQAEIDEIAECLTKEPKSNVPCTQKSWGITAQRSQHDIVDGLQRQVTTVLLRQAKRIVDSEVLGTENSLVFGAEQTPAFAVYGYGSNQQLILETAWREFLRKRSTAEISDITKGLYNPADNAFDAAESAARNIIGYTDDSAAKQPMSDAEMSLIIDEIQTRYGDGSLEKYAGHATGKPSVNVEKTSKGTYRTTTRVYESSDFNVSSMLDLDCERASPELQALLRFSLLPNHRIAWNYGHESHDKNGFGAYVLREWSDQLCFGISLDTSASSPEKIRAKVKEIKARIEKTYCGISSEQWGHLRNVALEGERLLWSKDQAFDLTDMRNWVRSRDALSSAREVFEAAKALSPEKLCVWNSSNREDSNDEAVHIEVLVHAKDSK